MYIQSSSFTQRFTLPKHQRNTRIHIIILILFYCARRKIYIQIFNCVILWIYIYTIHVIRYNTILYRRHTIYVCDVRNEKYDLAIANEWYV